MQPLDFVRGHLQSSTQHSALSTQYRGLPISTAVNISFIPVLREFRVAISKYRADAAAALIEAESELSRTLVWLKYDRLPYWTSEHRRRQEMLTRAKSQMYRSVVASDTDGRAGVDQKKTLEKAQRMLAEAEEKLQNIRRWIRVLDHETVLYRGEVQALAGIVESDLAQAESRLERMAKSLEEYAQLAIGPAGSPSDADPSTTAPPTPQTPQPPTATPPSSP